MSRRRSYTNDELLDALRGAARGLGHTPTCTEYRRVTAELNAPRGSTIATRFRGWDGALAAAHLPPPRRGKYWRGGGGRQVWPEERIAESLRLFWREHRGHLRIWSDYLPLVRGDRRFPCLNLALSYSPDGSIAGAFERALREEPKAVATG